MIAASCTKQTLFFVAAKYEVEITVSSVYCFALTLIGSKFVYCGLPSGSIGINQINKIPIKCLALGCSAQLGALSSGRS